MKRKWFLGLFTMLLVAVICAPAYAASRKKISTVRVNVESHIKPEVLYGEEDIEIDVGRGRYSYDYYTIQNMGFEWYEEDIPEITIYLSADEGYYFSLTKASQVKLEGATYVKAVRENSSSTLALTVKLPPMSEQVADLEVVNLTSEGYAYWDPPAGAGSYELRFYRNGSAIGATETVIEDTVYNMDKIMNRPGLYSIKVRPRNKIKEENKGKWKESNAISLTSDQARAIRAGISFDRPLHGKWMRDEIGGWWYQFDNGTYVKDRWWQIDGKWYFFDENGYMKTGWISWEGKEYYCKEGSGEMLTNTTTPDGYILDENGNKKTD